MLSILTLEISVLRGRLHRQPFLKEIICSLSQLFPWLELYGTEDTNLRTGTTGCKCLAATVRGEDIHPGAEERCF